MANHLFISYKHQAASAKVAIRFHQYLKAVSAGLGFTVFIDGDQNPGGIWSQEIKDELEKTTHFISLITTSYWLSEACREELYFALDRFKATSTPRLLFVLVEELDPQWFVFDSEAGTGSLTSEDAAIKAVGDINFLGPFNSQRQLIRLEHENDAVLMDQFFELTKRIKKVLN